MLTGPLPWMTSFQIWKQRAGFSWHNVDIHSAYTVCNMAVYSPEECLGSYLDHVDLFIFKFVVLSQDLYTVCVYFLLNCSKDVL